jgi:polyphenol oxidase
MVTDRPGVLLGILTADCAPVLLADRAAGVAGAAHAGWRGAHGGVIGNTVAAMVALGAAPERIAAAVGPCIAQRSYEVGADLRERFAEGEGRFFAPGAEGRWQFDLPGYVAHRLAETGVGRIDVLGRDTYAEADAFFSFRRATHRGEPTYGRLLSLIGLDPAGST